MAAYAVTRSKDGIQPLTPKSRLDTLFSVMRITDLRRSELELNEEKKSMLRKVECYRLPQSAFDAVRSPARVRFLSQSVFPGGKKGLGHKNHKCVPNAQTMLPDGKKWPEHKFE